jgi:hypothetical protein
MRKRFAEIDCQVPTDFHVSVGFKPAGGYESARVMGCCYRRVASTANVNEIFISPEWDDPIEILATFAHELIHASSDCADGHGYGFKRYAVPFGLTGKMTATYAGPELEKWLKMVSATLGPYPHAKTRIFALKRISQTGPDGRPDGTPGASGGGEGGGKIHSGRPKQATAMLKLECVNPTCGFIARATAKNLDLGMPICACGTPLSSPQYAEVLYERLFNVGPWQGDPWYKFGRDLEDLEKRREWSRARGFLPALGAAVTTVVKAVTKKVAKPKAPTLPAPTAEAMAKMRQTLSEYYLEPYPATLADEERHSEEALYMWDLAEQLASLFQDIDAAMTDAVTA